MRARRARRRVVTPPGGGGVRTVDGRARACAVTEISSGAACRSVSSSIWRSPNRTGSWRWPGRAGAAWPVYRRHRHRRPTTARNRRRRRRRTRRSDTSWDRCYSRRRPPTGSANRPALWSSTSLLISATRENKTHFFLYTFRKCKYTQARAILTSTITFRNIPHDFKYVKYLM